MAKKIVAQPKATNNKATPNETYCPRCNESGMFCICKPFVADITTRTPRTQLEVKRLKRGTFLFSFAPVGGAAK